MEEIYNILGIKLSQELKNVSFNNNINEIRLRVGQNVRVISSNMEMRLDTKVNLKDILDILIRVSKNSIYTIQKEINNGYVVIRGGHRIGICGEVIVENGKIKNIKNINSMNIRVARQIIGCADAIMTYIVKEGQFQNTLIVSPPGCGKTTILRDVIRQTSNGIEILEFKGKNVGVVDERGEIAAVSDGITNLDVGMRTDIMSNIDKNVGMEMMIRSMGLDVIATDEIGNKKDIEAIKYAISSGISLVFTMHGRCMEDLLRKDELKYLLDEKAFKNVIFLSNKKGPGTIENVVEI